MKGLFVAALIVLNVSLSAQEAKGDQAFALLYAAAQDGILIIRSGRSLPIEDRSLPLVLVPGDQVTTDARSTAQIVSYPTLDSLTVGENTSVAIERLDESVTEVNLQFGRIRGAVLGENSSRLRVNGVAATVVSENGSFGVDQLVDVETGDVVAQAYALDGTLAVYPASTAGEELSDQQAVELPSGEAVAQHGLESVAQPDVIPQGVFSYWENREPGRLLINPEDLLATYASLEQEVGSALGSVPSYLFPPVPEPEPVVTQVDPEVEVEVQPHITGESESTEVAPQVEPTGSDEVPAAVPMVITDEAQKREQQSSVLRTTGAIAAVTGLIADISAVALHRYGADLLEAWPENEMQTIRTLSYTGGGLIAGGLLMLTLSVIIGN